MPIVRTSLPLLLALSLMVVTAVAASAQQPPPGQSPPAAAKPKKDTAPANPAGNEAALRQRVEQLEEQLVDLQVIIGTLESLAKPPPGQGAAAAAPADVQRIQALEAQLKTLSQQIEQLGEKVRGAGEPMRRSEQPPPSAPAAGGQDTATFGSATVTSSDPEAPARQSNPTMAAPQYETAPGSALPPLGDAPQGPQSPAASGQPDVAALEPGSGDPKHDYETAYSYIIQRDYSAAQAGFTAFMKRYPKDALVPNALYWLGETHYQQRNFADAAEAFDLVTKIYASSPKAADSQLKRALSYSALGKNNEACAALSDLDAKFENAPAYVKTRAGSERRRLGCTG